MDDCGLVFGSRTSQLGCPNIIDFRHGRFLHMRLYTFEYIWTITKRPYVDHRLGGAAPARAKPWAAPGPALGPRGPGLGTGRPGASESVVHIWSIYDGRNLIDYIFWNSAKIGHAEIDHICTTNQWWPGTFTSPSSVMTVTLVGHSTICMTGSSNNVSIVSSVSGTMGVRIAVL